MNIEDIIHELVPDAKLITSSADADRDAVDWHVDDVTFAISGLEWLQNQEHDQMRDLIKGRLGL